ncbi:ubiquinone anaerobic biosynthesis accessory factor UbiT [Microbulbifer yueqingensis]|uniref:Ubiquinone biosynthesis accessory factor UbiT n=1 Tax=Microbulbifer yueqingensis TaxID=658219 RepID=A0A1G8XJ10_9GAMM|nr:SCP2 sterol-binding domain-containing protein [Microbulbifer yueqingensis]SDJ90531.1 Predicted lipid carrier protein YhbT, contains SCP2 domain [Microbulbifer yueqingensis]
MNSSNSLTRSLASPLASTGYRLGCAVLKRMPSRPLELALVQLVNRQLRQEIADGEFDFLDGRLLEVAVTDLGLHLRITKSGERLQARSAGQPADATIAATARDFLAIANGAEDPDTLFFQRRLTVSGDTELGLTAKNSLDAVDRRRLPAGLQRCLLVMAGFLEAAAAPQARRS